MTGGLLKLLVSLVAVSFAIIPVATAAASLNASSVYTAQRGAGGPVTAPDANGDSFGQFGDGGPITGAFNGPIGWHFNYVVHTRTGLMEGTGTATCDPCTVAGLTGAVTFTVTQSGPGSVFSCAPNYCAQFTVVSGTWAIAGATGALAGITGAGNWAEANHSRFLTGSISLSNDCDDDGDGDDECSD